MLSPEEFSNVTDYAASTQTAPKKGGGKKGGMPNIGPMSGARSSEFATGAAGGEGAMAAGGAIEELAPLALLA